VFLSATIVVLFCLPVSGGKNASNTHTFSPPDTGRQSSTAIVAAAGDSSQRYCITNDIPRPSAGQGWPIAHWRGRFEISEPR